MRTWTTTLLRDGQLCCAAASSGPYQDCTRSLSTSISLRSAAASEKVINAAASEKVRSAAASEKCFNPDKRGKRELRPEVTEQRSVTRAMAVHFPAKGYLCTFALTTGLSKHPLTTFVSRSQKGVPARCNHDLCPGVIRAPPRSRLCGRQEKKGRSEARILC